MMMTMMVMTVMTMTTMTVMVVMTVGERGAVGWVAEEGEGELVAGGLEVEVTSKYLAFSPLRRRRPRAAG